VCTEMSMIFARLEADDLEVCLVTFPDGDPPSLLGYFEGKAARKSPEKYEMWKQNMRRTLDDIIQRVAGGRDLRIVHQVIDHGPLARAG
jgi:hypothetical protein